MAFNHEVFSLACLIVQLHGVNSVRVTQFAKWVICDIIYKVKDLICCLFLFLLPPRRIALLRGLFYFFLHASHYRRADDLGQRNTPLQDQGDSCKAVARQSL